MLRFWFWHAHIYTSILAHTHTSDRAIQYTYWTLNSVYIGHDIPPTTPPPTHTCARTHTHTHTRWVLKTGVCCPLYSSRPSINSLKIEMVELCHTCLSLSLPPFVFLTASVPHPCVLLTHKALMLITRHVACQSQKEKVDSGLWPIQDFQYQYSVLSYDQKSWDAVWNKIRME